MQLPRLSRGPLRLAVGSTGLKLYGGGEWKVRLHGKEKRRTWRKLHLCIDHRTREAAALSMTDKGAPDRRELPGLLAGVKGEVAEVLGGGAYDSQDCYKAIRARGARAVIPPRVRARVRSGPEFRGRNAAVLRGREVGRDEWKKEVGCHRRSPAETTMMRLKTVSSDRLKSREWRRQETGLRVRRAAMNKMTSLGMPRSYPA